MSIFSALETTGKDAASLMLENNNWMALGPYALVAIIFATVFGRKKGH